jgi:hypothetical protein
MVFWRFVVIYQNWFFALFKTVIMNLKADNYWGSVLICDKPPTGVVIRLLKNNLPFQIFQKATKKLWFS